MVRTTILRGASCMLLVACTAPQREPPRPPERSTAPTSTPAAIIVSPPPPCPIQALPAPIVPPAPQQCAPVAAKIQVELRAAFARVYSPPVPGARLVTSFDCDPLGSSAELIIERTDKWGYHTFTRLRWNGATIEALGITLGPASEPGEYFVDGRAGTAPATITASIPGLRGVLLARLDTVMPPPRARKGGGGYSSIGPHRHIHVRLTDDAGRVLEHEFTGPTSPMDGPASIPAAELQKRLEPVLAAIAWNRRADDAELRTFFTDRFVAHALPTSARAWQRARWVEQWHNEVLVRLAAKTGAPALIPALIDIARQPANSDSYRLVRHHALVALAALTGFDPRLDPTLSDHAAAEQYARACAAAMPPPPPPWPTFSPDEPPPPE